jgi:hypothetical protein
MNFTNSSLFEADQPSLNQRQMPSFYAFVGKLHAFLEGVAGEIQLLPKYSVIAGSVRPFPD